MNKNELLETLAKYNITPRKQHGQNFLIDNNILESMLKSIDFTQGSKEILEVGPGCGVLSRKLLQRGCNLTAIEIDKKIHTFLEDTLVKEDNFRLIKGDACRINLNEIMDLPRSFRCIANLPYAISSVFISRLLQCASPPEEAYFLLQEEMAERLIASFKTKEYNSLSVRIQSIYKAKIIKKVPPEVFYPLPRVNSAFLALIKLQDKYKNFAKLSELSKLVFLQRRKKFVKVAKSLYKEENLLESLKRVGLNPNLRPEEISVENFQLIVNYLQEV